MSSIKSNDLSKIMFRMYDLTLGPKQILSSIKEYEKQPLVSLEKSIKPLISFILDLGQNGLRTIFNIECDSAKDISHHSFHQIGKEILI